MTIGAPTNLTHLVHVDLDFRWSGDNPAVEFEFLSRYKESILELNIFIKMTKFANVFIKINSFF